MKISVSMVVMVLALLFMSGNLYAANGDLIVNGNLGVGTGTTAPTEKAEIKGNMKVDGTITSGGQTVNGNLCVGGNCTSTLHVSGGLYGHCKYSSGGCQEALNPAYCSSPYGAPACTCPSGYTMVTTSVVSSGYLYVYYYACYKN
jgi:hypothetical protein